MTLGKLAKVVFTLCAFFIKPNNEVAASFTPPSLSLHNSADGTLVVCAEDSAYKVGDQTSKDTFSEILAKLSEEHGCLNKFPSGTFMSTDSKDIKNCLDKAANTNPKEKGKTRVDKVGFESHCIQKDPSKGEEEAVIIGGDVQVRAVFFGDDTYFLTNEQNKRPAP